MKEFRYSDVKIDGCAFTLFPVCDEMNIDFECAKAILWAMHIGAKTIRPNGYISKRNEKVIAKNPVLPNVLYLKYFRDCDVKYAKKCIDTELLRYVARSKFEITEKMMEVLQKAAEKHKHLQGKH